ncbi:LysR family transcriptional regulator [Roseinatronobacter alkalisoli]|uniref:LysR substrate-binding domain-containing protein n=1 Tax=Roseinatronobacter alkalisoli TaxID=3028235 RepID=A0ABT5TIG4_9RHOB|nr:LysR family transcriptional regulator [Roseinatronobacter sp. HJB301]MDD7973728.1 LysR substrate-binding domain-containing protein [Roseinatronobacter sp. HJB301]
MDTISLKAYALIVEEGSFSAAARQLGISKSMCSKYISDLEDKLGARLLTRSTRSVKTTSIGMEYYQKVRRILDLLDEANEQAKVESGTVTGRLRIGSPVSFSLRALQPLILRFLKQHPNVQLESVFDDSRTNLISKGYDAVLCIGELADSSMVARRIHTTTCAIVASPGYLETYGTPRHPSDLSNHKILHYTNISTATTWPFQSENEIFWQKVTPRFASNNGEIIAAAAMADYGVAYLAEFMISDHLATGKLVPILAEYTHPDLPISIIYPSRKNISAALKAFLEFCTCNESQSAKVTHGNGATTPLRTGQETGLLAQQVPSSGKTDRVGKVSNAGWTGRLPPGQRAGMDTRRRTVGPSKHG